VLVSPLIQKQTGVAEPYFPPLPVNEAQFFETLQDLADKALPQSSGKRDLPLRADVFGIEEQVVGNAGTLRSENAARAPTPDRRFPFTRDDDPDTRENKMGVSRQIEPLLADQLAAGTACLGHERNHQQRMHILWQFGASLLDLKKSRSDSRRIGPALELDGKGFRSQPHDIIPLVGLQPPWRQFTRHAGQQVPQRIPPLLP
jgi:hypothetical protein